MGTHNKVEVILPVEILKQVDALAEKSGRDRSLQIAAMLQDSLFVTALREARDAETNQT